MRHSLLFIALTCLLLLAASLGTTEGDFVWSARTSGGGHYSLGSNTLDSAIGQPVVYLYSVSGYTVCSGFLCEELATWPLYMPVVRK